MYAFNAYIPLSFSLFHLRFILRFPYAQEDENRQKREQKPDTHTQFHSKLFDGKPKILRPIYCAAKTDYRVGNDADKLWRNRRAQIAASRHQSKDKHPSRRTFIGCDNKAPRPHHRGAKPRQSAGYQNQTKDGQRGKDTHKITNGRTDAAEKEHLFNVFPPFRV